MNDNKGAKSELPGAYIAEYAQSAPEFSEHVTTTIPTMPQDLGEENRPAIQQWNSSYSGYYQMTMKEAFEDDFVKKVTPFDMAYDISNRPNPYASWDNSDENMSVGAEPLLVNFTDQVKDLDAQYKGSNPFGDTYIAQYTGKAPTPVPEMYKPSGDRPDDPTGAKPIALELVAHPGSMPVWDEDGAYSWASADSIKRYYSYPTGGPLTPTTMPTDPGAFTMKAPEELPGTFAAAPTTPQYLRPTEEVKNPGVIPFYGILPPEPQRHQFKP